MPSKFLEADVDSYNASFRSCEKTKLRTKGFALLSEWPSKFLEADVVSYTAIFRRSEIYEAKGKGLRIAQRLAFEVPRGRCA